ncbi:long-chain-fatty-acid--CoA ligase [Streptomyces purpurogeneiscleroticus]|uniref:long-chain-fatty-acid--CoA ligase n=1 Tax=Streptomyces purpurogeneiscleroticus TaxID=68259 RepID=UPI001CBBBA9B|nr:long-chain-fatty-acid--CoA ligase [Streptomyces purpurogeneiscleroticus]MBZ4018972.1 long-chain fatty acid--CoA ligase [Streptomyces purpurogeneiscleroticus]
MQAHDNDAVSAARRMSYGAQLARCARKCPDRVALRHGTRALTFTELDERVSRLANALSARGVERGSRVAVVMHNRIEAAESYLAAVRLGAIAVPVNFRLVAAEIAYILADSGATALLVDERLAATCAEAARDAEGPIAVLVTGDPAAYGPDAERYEAVLAAASPQDPGIDVPENDPAFLMYTSGTTGRPKGAVLTHLNLVMAAFTVLSATGGIQREPDVALLGVPMFHIAGLSVTLRGLLDGGRLVIDASPAFDPAAFVDLLEKERITSCFLVPSQWQAVCAVPGIKDRELALRTLVWGASVAPPSVLESLQDCFPEAPAYSAFGQTEMSPTTTMLRAEDAVRKMGSVGTPLPGIEVRIVDEEMRDVPVGEVGEIVYRGPTTMLGYWNKPAETAAVFAGGWFHSGDLCRMDEEGFIYVVDRKKDMIISGGENIYCAEVEAAIDAHPGVAEVAVIGVDHPKWVQTPRAVVVPADPANPPAEKELIDHCRSRLASYKKPTSVVFVDAMPRNASGKIQKFRLRERYGGAAGDIHD